MSTMKFISKKEKDCNRLIAVSTFDVYENRDSDIITSELFTVPEWRKEKLFGVNLSDDDEERF